MPQYHSLPSSDLTCSHRKPHQLDDSAFWSRDPGQNDPWSISHAEKRRTLPDRT